LILFPTVRLLVLERSHRLGSPLQNKKVDATFRFSEKERAQEGSDHYFGEILAMLRPLLPPSAAAFPTKSEL
jgi:hypothetical protein